MIKSRTRRSIRVEKEKRKMALISYRYYGKTSIREFKTFGEMRNFATEDRTRNGRYLITSPLRCVSYRREQIVEFGLDEQQARELNIRDTRE